MAKKMKNVQSESDKIRIRDEELENERKEKLQQLKRIKRLLRRAEDRNYDVSGYDISQLENLSSSQLKKITPKEIYSQIEYVIPNTGTKVSGTTGRKIEYQNAYEKGYYTRTGREYVYVEPEYQSIITGAIDRFREWLNYDDFREYSQGKSYLSYKRYRKTSRRSIESNLEYISEVKSYISNVFENLIIEKGEYYVANILIQNATEMQIEMDLITYKGPSDAEVTRASFNTLIEILTQDRDIYRAKNINRYEENSDFIEEV